MKMMTKCLGPRYPRSELGCGLVGEFRVAVLNPGKESSGDYCRSHASTAIVRAAFGGQRVMVVRPSGPKLLQGPGASDYS